MWSIYFYEKVKMTKLTVKILIWCFYPRGLWFHTSLLLTERDQFTDKVTPELKMWKKSLFSSQNLKQVSVAVHTPASSLILPSYSFQVCALLSEWRRGPARLFLQMHLSQQRDAVILIVLGNLDWEKQREKWKLKANSLPQRPCILSFSACSENVSLTSVICKVISRSTMTARRSSATGGRANLPVALKRIFKRVLIRKYNEIEGNAAHYLSRGWWKTN